jgi:hypothetical protein
MIIPSIWQAETPMNGRSTGMVTWHVPPERAQIRNDRYTGIGTAIS